MTATHADCKPTSAGPQAAQARLAGMMMASPASTR